MRERLNSFCNKSVWLLVGGHEFHGTIKYVGPFTVTLVTSGDDDELWNDTFIRISSIAAMRVRK